MPAPGLAVLIGSKRPIAGAASPLTAAVGAGESDSEQAAHRRCLLRVDANGQYKVTANICDGSCTATVHMQ